MISLGAIFITKSPSIGVVIRLLVSPRRLFRITSFTRMPVRKIVEEYRFPVTINDFCGSYLRGAILDYTVTFRRIKGNMEKNIWDISTALSIASRVLIRNSLFLRLPRLNTVIFDIH